MTKMRRVEIHTDEFDGKILDKKIKTLPVGFRISEDLFSRINKFRVKKAKELGVKVSVSDVFRNAAGLFLDAVE